MFSTDVAARGLDFPNIDWVLQFDAPEDSASYIHRVGRAGRFRSKGNALTFVLPSEEAAFLDMMAEARIPVKRIAVNPSRTESVTRRVMQEVAKDTELNALAVGAFRSYVRSVALAGNKAMFDVEKLPLDSFAESLGLGVVPKVNLKQVGERARGDQQKKKSSESYALQQLREEMREEEGAKEESANEESGSDNELLVATGKTTLSIDESELPALPVGERGD